MNLSYFSPKIEKRSSPIEGRGLFAKAPIAKGEVVVVKGGYVMTMPQRDAVSERLGPADIQIADDLFIGPVTDEEREGGMMHLNHSCDPNLGIQGQIVFVALRDIEIDEELSFDYAMGDDAPWEMTCHCGSSRCRGTVTGYDWKRPELQERYDGYFSIYLHDKINTARQAE
ncbi:SET domain-containing protein [Candidatus Entotheonella palauensis]|uniref:SET domain-containing protein n=1 Tax=Candidatus Entotheonella palauensis TaxID=93172 RepID=UPI000B7CE024|nr:SET domain-containing protein-lysine N-methyltransferase [Candidatus Entotheonella palauensis]